jgi:hypothetical protein
MAARLAVLLLALVPSLISADVAVTELSLSRLNRVYEDVAGETPPLRLDPVTVRLSSPHQTVLLKENRIRLEPLGGDRFAVSVELDLLGKGDLIAEVDLAGTSQTFTDEVLLPPQSISVEGVVRLSRLEGGYRIVIERLPEDVRVTIRSRLVGDVLGLCAGAALLSLGSLDCDPVAEALERPRLPLPGPGSELFLSDEDLTDEDRRVLDGLLTGD